MICSANQWIGFYMIGIYVMKELKPKMFLIITMTLASWQIFSNLRGYLRNTLNYWIQRYFHFWFNFITCVLFFQRGLCQKPCKNMQNAAFTKARLYSPFRVTSLIYAEKFEFENAAIMEDKQCKQTERFSVIAKGSDCFSPLMMNLNKNIK